MQQPKVCIHCHLPIYYSWGYRVWAHEGHRPSKVAAQKPLLAKHPNMCFPGTWAKWIPCEDADGNLTGTDATYWSTTNEEGAGI